MVLREGKEAMKAFIEGRIEDSGRYDIQESDSGHVLIAQKPSLVEEPQQIYVALMQGTSTVAQYQALISQNIQEGKATATVFNRDAGFLSYLGQRAQIKGRGRSLKHYDDTDISCMVHLRDLEKEALRVSSESSLVYYQPESLRLEEAIRGFNMGSVMLDYSHVQRGHRSHGFVTNKPSEDYRIALPLFTTNRGAVGFSNPANMRQIITMSDTDYFTPEPQESPKRDENGQGELF